MVLVWEHPLSPYAQKVKIALAEKNVAFECRSPDFVSGQDPEFAAANPRLEVPALVDGETHVFDSTIILEYVEERWPTPPLLPATPAERARVRMLEELCDTYYEPIAWAAMEINVFQRATGELAAKLLARGRQQVAGVNAYLDRQLGDRQWFNGTAFGWGDRHRPVRPRRRDRGQSAGGRDAARRLARAGAGAAERRRRVRRGRGEHAGVRDDPAAHRVGNLQARVP